VWGQYNQRIPFRVCELVADTSRCFALSGSNVYQVSGSVVNLGDLFRLCMQADTFTTGAEAIRVILAIDHSGSMCTYPSVAQANDPTDQRIAAAHAFLDSLVARSPGSELGVVRFYQSCGPSGATRPLPINNPANVAILHNEIRQAACNPANDPYFNKQLRAMATYQGCALQASYDSLMLGYSASDPRPMHVIQLTDDGWTVAADLTPQQVLANFRSRYPGVPYPTTHAVFLSSSGSTSDPNLRMITDSTDGIFIPNATPATIVQTFMDILGQILVPKAEALYVLTVTHTQTGLQQEAMISKLSGLNDYLVRSLDMPLNYGLNTFVFSKVYQTVDGRTLSVDRDTLEVERMEGSVAPPGGMFSLACGPDSTDIVITCAPTRVETGVSVTVDARVQADKAQRFVPGEVTVRGLKRYETGTANVAALYHLDGSLVDAMGNANGTGTVGFTSTNAAFGACMGSGSFTAALADPQAAEYTLEAWVCPALSAPAATLISGGGYSLALTSSGRLQFTCGGTVTGWANLARGVWQHVAVVREGGQGRLYVNGVPASGAAAVNAVTFGTVTVGPPGNGRIDEVRLSTVSRAADVGGVRQITLPAAAGITWTMPQGTVAAATAPLPSQYWHQAPAGSVSFTFTGSSAVDVVVNFLHTADGMVWSANGNPVSIWSLINAVPVTAQLYDDDGDGYLDRIVIVLPDTSTLIDPLPDIAALLAGMTLTLPNGSTVSLSGASLARLNDTSFTINLNEHGSGALETGWRGAAITFTAVPVTTSGQPIQVTQVLDRAGPVVARAVYKSGSGGADTLLVTFSEPVVWQGIGTATPADVFAYHQGSQVVTAPFAGMDGGNLVNHSAQGVSIVMDNGFGVTPMEDSLRFQVAISFVRDSAGNTPQDRRAPIEWVGSGKVVLVPGPSNPLVHGTPIPATVVTFYGNVLRGSSGAGGGVIVGIQATKPLQSTGTDPSTGASTYGTAVVFDAVGNVVRNDLYVLQASAGYRDYGVYWDGQNSRGRRVGGGTYLMIVKMRDVDGKSLNERTKIGVKHKT